MSHNKRLLVAVILGLFLLTIALPVAAAVYYAYLTIEEENGNDYEELALTCTRNITQLVQYDLITSTGLDTRVLTGEGSPLPHMLAEDRIMFVSDLDAYETKTLIFYCGATSLSNFYIIPGYGGYITTEDDPDLELTYVIELLFSGYFDASTGSDKNILYKEDAYRVYISDDDEITVAGLSAGDVEEWTMTYSSFTDGEHTVYVMANGLGAYLYVDTFDVAKDTHNLYESTCAVLHSSGGNIESWFRYTFYTQGKYWVFYGLNDSKVYYKTSSDGVSWSSEYSISTPDTSLSWATVTLRDTYLHLTYADDISDTVKYRRGVPNADSSITWSDVWQTVVSLATNPMRQAVAADTDNYPFVIYQKKTPTDYYTTYISKSSTNNGTWSTAGGYPLEVVSGVGHGDGCAITDYPNSDKMYMLYRTGSQLRGKYYNGASWSGGSDAIYTADTATEASCVADNDDNVYIVWQDYDDNTIYFRIRYSDGSLSATIEISDGVPTGYSGVSVSYNPDTDYIYITYIRAGSARCVTYNQNELTGEYTLFTPADLYQMSAAAYGSHIGIAYRDYSPSQTGHGYLQFPWSWNDNANNWTWMQNNVMPYADYFTMAIDGVTVLDYEPADIIEGTTLPDEESDHDGIITWGSNPAGVTTSLSMLSPESEEDEDAQVAVPGVVAPGDMVGPTGQPGMTADIGLLADNPFYPVVSMISDNANVPVRLVWIIFATIILFIIMMVSFRYAPHQIITALAGGGWAAFCWHLGIYPLWVLFIFGAMAIAVVISERSPVIS